MIKRERSDANYDTYPRHAAGSSRAGEKTPPLFKADTVNIAVSASKDGNCAWSTTDGTTRRSSSERLRPDPAWRPQSDRQARALPVTSGEGGSPSPDRYASREVLARLGLVQLMVPTRGGPGRASLRTRVSWRRDLLGSRLSPG